MLLQDARTAKYVQYVTVVSGRRLSSGEWVPKGVCFWPCIIVAQPCLDGRDWMTAFTRGWIPGRREMGDEGVYLNIAVWAYDCCVNFH